MRRQLKWNTVISLHCKYTGNQPGYFILQKQLDHQELSDDLFSMFLCEILQAEIYRLNVQLKNPKSPLLHFTTTSTLSLQSNTWKLRYFETPFEALKKNTDFFMRPNTCTVILSNQFLKTDMKSIKNLCQFTRFKNRHTAKWFQL